MNDIEDLEEEEEINHCDMSFWRPREKYKVKVTCLKCDSSFLGVSKFNRLCDNCTYSNEHLRSAFI